MSIPKNKHEALSLLVTMATSRACTNVKPNKKKLLIAEIDAAERILLFPGNGSYCGNNKCHWTGPDPGVNTIEDLYVRVRPGQEAPTGQCPQCGLLTFKQQSMGYQG